MRFELAKNYDRFAVAQKIAAKKLAELLKNFGSSFESAYEIGCGSGILTKHLEDEFQIAHLTLNDLYKAAPMQRFEFQIGDIQTLSIPYKLNLIASSSVLQWIDDLENLFVKIHAALDADGIFAAALFTEGTLRELENFTHQGIRYKTSDEISALLPKNFEVLDLVEEACTISFDTLHDLLDSLKQTGVNNLQGTFQLTKNSFREMERYFEGKFQLTYKFTAFVAKKI